MSNIKSKLGLIVFFAAVMLFAGCLPEISLKWTEDGSVGLLNVGRGLYLVDGKTGELTEIADGVGPLPDISKDGKWIVSSERVTCDDLSEGLKLLPPGQVKMIEYTAEQMRKNILAAGKLTNDQYGFPEEGLLIPDEYRNWAIHYLVEKSDSELLKILGTEGIEKAKERVLWYSQIVVVPKENPAQPRRITASVFKILTTRLSPDARFVAYLMHTQEGEVSNSYEEYALYVASVEGDMKAMYVDSRVAFGYDWRKDSKAIAYLNAEAKELPNDDFILGSLSEKMVVDADGNLLSEPENIPTQGLAGTHHCTGKKADLAGTAFYPWMKVEYGLGDRIFFSSIAMPLPVSKRDEVGCSLFCFDPVLGTVTDVLPLSVSSYVSQQILSLSLFSLSPDGKRVLLPIMNNRFIVYELGTSSMDIPIGEEEGFGEEELPEMAPSWKGNNEFSCLVSGKSTFLPPSMKDQDETDRREIVVLGKDGNTWKAWVLSHHWPDEIASEAKDDQ